MYEDDHQQSNDTHKLRNHTLDRWLLSFVLFFFFWNAHWSPSFRTHRHTENKQNINATACLVNRLKSRINYLDVFIKHVLDTEMGFPGVTVVKASTYQCRRCKRRGFDPWVRKIPRRRKWQLIPVFLPGKFHGQRSLVDQSPWGRKELDTTEWLTLAYFYKVDTE